MTRDVQPVVYRSAAPQPRSQADAGRPRMAARLRRLCVPGLLMGHIRRSTRPMLAGSIGRSLNAEESYD